MPVDDFSIGYTCLMALKETFEYQGKKRKALTAANRNLYSTTNISTEKSEINIEDKLEDMHKGKTLCIQI